ncbi:peptidase S26 family protein (plasmid) [Phycisphaera mikurensis NBRC 102666]|uniref:Peptidase S26 family protein n=2 Tax=Phycisphaera TaxID=666508 RepID=I0IJJ7_PHYMF|nr:peptidase S26 family protein [Phycisphaera mikurensis NBRC 102666]
MAAVFLLQWAWMPIVIQPSASVERGLWVRGWGAVAKGDLVLIDAPDAVIGLLDRHGRHGHTRLLKPVAGLVGQTVRCDESGLVIDGVRLAPTARVTSQGEAMPVFGMDRVLQPGEAWLLAEGVLTSVDSRCFGPVVLDEAQGPYRLWWSWDR